MLTMRPYPDRAAAGRALADELGEIAGSVLVLGLARGGVPVAAPVADALGAKLDVLIVRKLGLPEQPELAMGAIAGVGGYTHTVRNEPVLAEAGEHALADVLEEETRELKRREQAYRGDRPAIDVRGQVVILVDDGLATGSSMRAAALAVREQSPERVVVAVPVAAGQTCEELRADVDDVVCLLTPEPFYAVGAWYEDFAPTSDDEVRRLLAAADSSPVR
jgi:putative phosphoribosyl transferase